MEFQDTKNIQSLSAYQEEIDIQGSLLTDNEKL
jgi:hypothetical protein